MQQMVNKNIQKRAINIKVKKIRESSTKSAVFHSFSAPTIFSVEYGLERRIFKEEKKNTLSSVFNPIIPFAIVNSDFNEKMPFVNVS